MLKVLGESYGACKSCQCILCRGHLRPAGDAKGDIETGELFEKLLAAA